MRSEPIGKGLLQLKPASKRFDHRLLPIGRNGLAGGGSKNSDQEKISWMTREDCTPVNRWTMPWDAREGQSKSPASDRMPVQARHCGRGN